MAMTTNCSGVWRIGEEDIARTESKTGAGSMKGEIESPAGKTATKTTTKGGPSDATIAAARRPPLKRRKRGNYGLIKRL